MLPIRGASKRTGKPDRKAGAQSHGTTSGPPGYRKERGNPMKGKTKKIVLAVAVIGALAAGGAAFTEANVITGPNAAGYGHLAVTGADVTDVHYTLDGTGENITAVDLTTTTTDLTGLTVQIAFNNGTLIPCGTPTAHTVSCTVSQDTALATDLAVSVSH